MTPAQHKAEDAVLIQLLTQGPAEDLAPSIWAAFIVATIPIVVACAVLLVATIWAIAGGF